ncbi:MAG: DUF3343 domain-containing protein [Ruminococcaceae bacterium]|nr:DUF3343 domain-containing protein [Oscillospiraceae bacterium]
MKGMVTVTCRFGLGSITYAVMAQNLLARRGISSKIVKLDARSSMKGCAYGVETDCRDYKSASVALNKEGISFREIK